MRVFTRSRRPHDQAAPIRAGYACLAGLVGITANTAMLKVAPLIHIHPGAGGLLQLLLLYADRWAPWTLPALHRVGLEKPPSLFGFLWFHYLTGMMMILFYFFVFSRYLPGSRWRKATIFSVLLWIVNAAFVLPRLGQGFAGIHKVPILGVLYFLVANWVFVIISDLTYHAWSSSGDPTM